MKISILGAGNVAQTLGTALINKGHEVFIGYKEKTHSEKLTQWLQQVDNKAKVSSVIEAAEFGEIIILAINPWTEIEAVLKSIPSTSLKGKTLIDLSNNIVFEGLPKLAFTDISMGELIQSWVPDTHVVKTLNITPTAIMVNPEQQGIVPSAMWVSGNSPQAKLVTGNLLKELGWQDVFDIGPISFSKLQETIGLITTNVVTGLLAKYGQPLK